MSRSQLNEGRLQHNGMGPAQASLSPFSHAEAHFTVNIVSRENGNILNKFIKSKIYLEQSV